MKVFDENKFKEGQMVICVKPGKKQFIKKDKKYIVASSFGDTIRVKINNMPSEKYLHWRFEPFSVTPQEKSNIDNKILDLEKRWTNLK